jgi:hypothetical protein
MSIRFLDNVSVSANAVFGKTATFFNAFAKSLTADIFYYYDGSQYVNIDQQFDNVTNAIFTEIGEVSGRWDTAYLDTTSILNNIPPVSGNWNSTYNIVSALSGFWSFGGDVTVQKISAAPAVHFHVSQDILDLNTVVNQYAEQAIALGAGVLYASLDENGKIPPSQLPSFVDQIVEYPSFFNFPTVGNTATIYGAQDTNTYYRWTGTRYFAISTGTGTTDGIAEGTNNLYYTDARVLCAVPVRSVNNKLGDVQLTITDIPNLAVSLNNKSDVTHTHPISAIQGLQYNIDIKSNVGHSHLVQDVSGLSDRLNAKADLIHFHGIDSVIGLRPTLEDKAPLNHTHTTNNITNFNSGVTAILTNAIGVNIPSLVNGKIPTTFLPNSVEQVIEFSTYAALTGYLFPSSNDIYHVLDGNRIFRYSGTSYIEIPSSFGTTDSLVEGSVNLYLTPQRVIDYSPVRSVNNLTGFVELTYADITGLSDILQSKAQAIHFHNISEIIGLQDQLSSKADVSHTHSIFSITGLAASLSAKADAIHTHGFEAINGLTEALNNKALSGHTHAFSDVPGLTEALQGKAASNHVHQASDINGLQTLITSTVQSSIGTNTVTLDPDTGTITPEVLPVDYQGLFSTFRNTSATFAPINSPNFTGTPRVPTPTLSEFSTVAPNTQWVRDYVNLIVTGSGARLSSVDIDDFTQAVSAILPVYSVAGRYGNITLTSSDISDFISVAASSAPVQDVAGRTGSITLSSSDIVDFNSRISSVYPVAVSNLTAGRVEGNLLITGGLTALSGIVLNNSFIATSTSALSVVNTGPGPALYIQQASGAGNVASFYDMDGSTALFVGNARNPGGIDNPQGVVGILTDTPNRTLTVAGEISASRGILTEGSVNATAFVGDGSQLTNMASLVQGIAWNSPVFNGTPTAPNPDESESSTRIATTNWVSNKLFTVFSAAQAAADAAAEVAIKVPRIDTAFNYATACLTTPVHYVSTIGDGVTGSFILTHNLQTKNLIVQVQDESTGYQVLPAIQYINNNQIQVDFNFIPNVDAYKAVVYAVGVIPAGTQSTSAYKTQKFASTFGNGTDLEYTISHGLGSEDVIVQVRDSAKRVSYPNIDILNSTQIKLTYTVAPTNHRVTIIN